MRILRFDESIFQSTNSGIKNANAKILYDIDILSGFIEDLDDIGYKTRFSFYLSAEIDKPARAYENTDEFNKYVTDNIEEYLPTIQYNISGYVDSQSSNKPTKRMKSYNTTMADDKYLMECIEDFKGKLKSFTDCRIDLVDIDVDKKFREDFTKSGNSITNNTKIELKIIFTNIRSTRYKHLISNVDHLYTK